jgi:hypothetical protein
MKRLNAIVAIGVLVMTLFTSACGTIVGGTVGAGTGAAIGAGTGYGAKKGAIIGGEREQLPARCTTYSINLSAMGPNFLAGIEQCNLHSFRSSHYAGCLRCCLASTISA